MVGAYKPSVLDCKTGPLYSVSSLRQGVVCGGRGRHITWVKGPTVIVMLPQFPFHYHPFIGEPGHKNEQRGAWAAGRLTQL